MPDSSNADKFRAVTRVVGRRAGQNRWSRASYHAGRGFLNSVGNVIHGLFHQVTGLFFLVFGSVVGFGAFREYRAYSVGKIGPGRVVLAAVLALMFIYFGFSAFIRAGRKRR